MIKSTCVDSDIYKIAIGMIEKLQRFSTILDKAPQDKASTRQLLLSNINKIKLSTEDEYLIYPAYAESSTKCTEWYAHEDLNLRPDD